MLITVRVHPRAARARAAWSGDQLEVWVTAVPAGGAANEAVIKSVARILDVPPSTVKIRSGAHGRTKLLEISRTAGPDAHRSVNRR